VASYLKKKTGEQDKCILLMHPHDVSLSVDYKWVMGDQFLQNFYSIFDYKKKRIALVAPADEVRDTSNY